MLKLSAILGKTRLPKRVMLREQPTRLVSHLRNARDLPQETYRHRGLRAFFGLGIRLLNRHRFPWKFTLLGLLVMMATGIYVVSLNLSMRAELNAARAEAASLDLYLPLTDTLHAARAYGLQAWGGTSDPALREELTTRAAAVDAAFKTFDDELTRRGDAFGLGERWKSVKAEWQKIRAAGAPNAAQAAELLAPFQRHLEDLVGDLGEAGQLLADPNRGSKLIANLLIRKFPEAASALGELADTSIRVLGSKEMDSDWSRVAGLMEDASHARASLLDTLARAADANPEDRADFERLASAQRDRWQQLFDSVDSEIRRGGFGIGGEAFIPLARQAADELLAGLAPAVLRFDAQLDERVARLEQRFWISSTIGACLVGLLLYCAFGLFVTILASVRELSEGARQIGSGRLGFRIRYHARDELHDVAEQFNGMAAAFAGIIDRVQHTSGELATAARSLAQSSARVTEGSAQQSAAASSMAAAVEEMTVGIDEISRHAAAADQAASESGDRSVEGGETVARTVAEMEQIAASVRQAAAVITELGQNSHQISTIVKSIKEIAYQTNLLALNAAIEAARASEEGRGFAVVADEVRKLAERTSSATAEIATMVGSIQAGTTRAVTAMQDGVRRVQQGVALSNQSGNAMQQTREESARALTAVSEISSALREQTAASTEIARSVETIAHMAESNHARVTRTGQTVSGLVALSTELESEVSRFDTRSRSELT